jgi:hypothetical protein
MAHGGGEREIHPGVDGETSSKECTLNTQVSVGDLTLKWLLN